MTIEEYCQYHFGKLMLEKCALAAEVDRLKAEVERLKNEKSNDPTNDPARGAA